MIIIALIAAPRILVSWKGIIVDYCWISGIVGQGYY